MSTARPDPQPGDYISMNGRRFECRFVKNGEVHGEAYEESSANGIDTLAWHGGYRIPLEQWHAYAAADGARVGNSRDNTDPNM